jgi:GNAT superfamily N-acetyltransferase
MIATASGFTTRAAGPADNVGLVTLAASSPMEAGLTICVRREPDFFALNRLEGDRWDVGVVDGPAPSTGIVGCIGVAERLAFVSGVAQRTAYIGDLKVHPAYRGRGVADELSRYAREICHGIGGDDLPCLVTALAGNRGVERRVEGPRGLPELRRFATVRNYAIPLFLPRREPRPDQYRVRRASAADVEEMACLWRSVARERQFAPVDDVGDLHGPGLSIEDYWLAHRVGTGRLAAFIALWDQHSFKRTHVLRYGARIGALRQLLNVAAPVFAAPRLPASGMPLRQLAAFRVAAPASEPAALRALLDHAYAEHRRSKYVLITIGLDVRDPLSRALDGLMAIPTTLHAYVTTPAGVYRGPDLGDRPLHFETALV